MIRLNIFICTKVHQCHHGSKRLSFLRLNGYQSNAHREDCQIQNSKEGNEFTEIDKDFERIHIVYPYSISVDIFNYSALLRRCAKLGSLREGKCVHSQLIKNGIEMNIYVENHLLNMYAKCHSFDEARQVFDKMHHRNVASWTALISGFAQYGDVNEALALFNRLRWTRIKPNQLTFGTVLSACVMADRGFERGKAIHGYAIRTGLESDVIVGNALVAMYTKFANFGDACHVFDRMPERDLVSWNSLIAGYAQFGCVDHALKVFSQIYCSGLRADQFTYVTLLGVCQSVHALQHGREIHAHSIVGFGFNAFVGNALINMYVKCGCLGDGKKVFDKLYDKTVVSWTSMISGYVQQCLYGEAIELFQKMLQAIVKPNQFTFSSVLCACSGLAALEHGKQVHVHIIRTLGDFNTYVGNTLITMYAECGSIDDSRTVFDKMPNRDLVSWNAMIGGYAQHGLGKEALHFFRDMQWEGTKPDPVTFVGLLSACSHEGLVDQGQFYFQMMSREYCIHPGPVHYACMVDLLGRAGYFDEAERLMDNMPFEPDARVWGALMGACRSHGKVELGKYAAERLYVLETENTAAHVLLSHIYATAGMWDEALKVRKSMRSLGLQKKPGCSWIEIRNEIHAFVLEDR